MKEGLWVRGKGGACRGCKSVAGREGEHVKRVQVWGYSIVTKGPGRHVDVQTHNEPHISC